VSGTRVESDILFYLQGYGLGRMEGEIFKPSRIELAKPEDISYETLKEIFNFSLKGTHLQEGAWHTFYKYVTGSRPFQDLSELEGIKMLSRGFTLSPTVTQGQLRILLGEKNIERILKIYEDKFNSLPKKIKEIRRYDDGPSEEEVNADRSTPSHAYALSQMPCPIPPLPETYCLLTLTTILPRRDEFEIAKQELLANQHP
jgi:hypothetical protein